MNDHEKAQIAAIDKATVQRALDAYRARYGVGTHAPCSAERCTLRDATISLRTGKAGNTRLASLSRNRVLALGYADRAYLARRDRLNSERSHAIHASRSTVIKGERERGEKRVSEKRAMITNRKALGLRALCGSCSRGKRYHGAPVVALAYTDVARARERVDVARDNGDTRSLPYLERALATARAKRTRTLETARNAYTPHYSTRTLPTFTPRTRSRIGAYRPWRCNYRHEIRAWAETAIETIAGNVRVLEHATGGESKKDTAKRRATLVSACALLSELSQLYRRAYGMFPSVEPREQDGRKEPTTLARPIGHEPRPRWGKCRSAVVEVKKGFGRSTVHRGRLNCDSQKFDGTDWGIYCEQVIAYRLKERRQAAGVGRVARQLAYLDQSPSVITHAHGDGVWTPRKLDAMEFDKARIEAIAREVTWSSEWARNNGSKVPATVSDDSAETVETK